MSTTHATTRAVAVDPFSARCIQLGVPLWRCDAAGRVVDGPIASPVLTQWLGGDLIRHRIQDATAAMAQSSDRIPVQFIPGCTLTPLNHGPAVRRGPFAVAMTVDAAVLETIDIVDSCEMVDLGLDVVREALRAVPASDPRMSSMLCWMYTDLCDRKRDDVSLGEFSEKLVQAYEETHLLFRLARLANSIHDPEQLMQTFCQQLQMILPFRWTAVRFCPEGNGVPDLAGRLIVAGELPCDSARFEHVLGTVMGRWQADTWTRMLHPRDSELAALTGAEIIIDPITHDGRVVGAILAGNKQGNDPDLSSVETQFIDASADFLGVFHENLARFMEQRALFLGTLQSLTASIDAKDPYTCGHSERVALLASQMAAVVGMNREDIEQVRVAGLVHDVGKIGVPEAVLCKNSRLTDEEFALIKKHPEIGHHILKDIPLMERQLPGVLHHHERWDGRGYPYKLKGEDIPMIARILALADTFDAMSSNRAYRAAMPREKVLAEILTCGGTQFDPALVSGFVAMDFSVYDQTLARQRAEQVTQRATGDVPVAAASAPANEPHVKQG